jgi:lysocardiolipin and lysophospholipid acyltransferase
MTYTLLPRSTGLQYSLRSLAPRIPTLQLLDVTVAYPGIPPLGYGQSYYTLRSIFIDRVPPPAVHMHLRLFSVARDVPIGDVSTSNPSAMPTKPTAAPGAQKSAVEVDVPEAESAKFEEWLRQLWRDKDEDMARYLAQGSFTTKEKEVAIPMKLRAGRRELLDAICVFVSAALVYFWSK